MADIYISDIKTDETNDYMMGTTNLSKKLKKLVGQEYFSNLEEILILLVDELIKLKKEK